MTESIADIVSAVKVVLDLNTADPQLTGIGDYDTLTVDEIVRSTIERACRIVESTAPYYMLSEVSNLNYPQLIISWEGQNATDERFGNGRVVLPNDFMRLVSFKMSDWELAVHEPVSENSPIYRKQRSRWKGVRGTPEKPVVAIVHKGATLVLEFYSSTTQLATIEDARYIPVRKITTSGSGTEAVEQITFSDQLRDAIVYYCAYLTALSHHDADMAKAMLAAYQNMLGKNDMDDR